jgi:hypothetical protein
MPDWTADELADVTRNTVGRAMAPAEFDAWVSRFMAEHGGRAPWQEGPFDADNNLLDHLLALGESERAAASGGYGSAAYATGNRYQDQAVTPDFWTNAYYSRYRAPTYPAGMEGQPWAFDEYQYLPPGFVPAPQSPTALAARNAGADYEEWYPLLRRPYYPYYPVVDLSNAGGGYTYGGGVAWPGYGTEGPRPIR